MIWVKIPKNKESFTRAEFLQLFLCGEKKKNKKVIRTLTEPASRNNHTARKAFFSGMLILLLKELCHLVSNHVFNPTENVCFCSESGLAFLLHQTPVPVTPTLDPLRMLMDDADVAAWQNEGLPADRMSVENATILLNCERWPLMVDPQLQGIKWIKNKYGEDLQVTQIGQKG